MNEIRKKCEGGLKVAFEYEDGPVPRFSVVEALAGAAEAIVRWAPAAVPSTAFCESSKAMDWFSGKSLAERGAWANSPLDTSVKRLRAITVDSKPLIEHSYGTDGHRKATTYPDGVVVRYAWDGQGRTATLSSSSGEQTTLTFRPDQRIERAVYDRKARFLYDYDSDGHVTSLTYPDGVRLQRAFGRDGRLTAVSCGTARLNYRWSSAGELEEYAVESGSNRARFVASAKRFECVLAPLAAGPQSSSRISVNPFGVWQFGAEGSLDKLLAPWGERLVARRSRQGLPLAVWGMRGIQRFAFSQAQVLQTVIAENGQRRYFHNLPNRNKVLCLFSKVSG